VTGSNGWAVGYVTDTAGNQDRPFILRLSGGRWSAVSTKLGAGADLTGVAATGAKATWATGVKGIAFTVGAATAWSGPARPGRR
jgi:hypothetical protein